MSQVFLRLKEEGNGLLASGDLKAAVKKYTEALSASQGIDNYKESCKAAAIALGNRSLAHLRLGNAERALADGEACKARDPTHQKAQYRIDQASKALADPSAPAAPALAPAPAPALAPAPAPARAAAGGGAAALAPVATKPDDGLVPVTILTGFLGAGKTTLLNHILTAEHGKKLAVIENEFGEVGIDDELLKKNTRMHAEEEIIEMMNGCICCTVRQDLITVLEKLAQRVESGLKLDGIVIETTGMANPAPVAQTFFVDPKVKKFARLDGVITLVDAKHVEQHLDDVKVGADNTAVEQLAFADRIILNKVDLVSEADLARVEARVRCINAFAPLQRSTQSLVSVDSVLNVQGFDLERTLEMDPEFLDTGKMHLHDQSVSSVSIRTGGDVHMMLVNEFINDLLKTRGPDIFRMKGVLSIAGSTKKFVYQGVHMIFDGKFEGDWTPGEERCSKLVFIGKKLDKAALVRSFRKCMNTMENSARIAAIERVKLQERQQGQLLSAAQRDDVRAIEASLAAGADINHGNSVGQTALHIACIWGNSSAVAALVKSGADVDKRNQPMLGEQTPVHMLASRTTNPGNRLECARILVAAGADLNAQDRGDQLAFELLDSANELPDLRALLTPKEARSEQ